MSRFARVTVGGTPRVIDAAAGSAQLTRAPFDPTSVWRLGIATGATFAAAGDTRNTAMHNTGADGSGLAWMNSDSYSHPVNYASVTDPLATVTDTVNGGSWTDRIPAAARIAAGTDAHMHVVSPDRRVVTEYFATTRVSSTAYNVGRRQVVNLRGVGIGPQNGCRAYGGSAIGGLIRGWEVDPTHPSYTGAIKHPLACALRGVQLFMDTANYGGTQGYYTSGTLDVTKYPGWPVGTPAAGFMRQTGYVWPASEQDWASPSNYSGTIPMGSYFAIPGTVDLTTLGLHTSQGMMLAKAAQDYGVYVTDSSGASSFYCEDDNGPARAFAVNMIDNDSYSGHDPRVVFNALRVVSSNGPTTPNGGAIGAARRG